jgi:hypothetical protein
MMALADIFEGCGEDAIQRQILAHMAHLAQVHPLNVAHLRRHHVLDRFARGPGVLPGTVHAEAVSLLHLASVRVAVNGHLPASELRLLLAAFDAEFVRSVDENSTVWQYLGFWVGICKRERRFHGALREAGALQLLVDLLRAAAVRLRADAEGDSEAGPRFIVDRSFALLHELLGDDAPCHAALVEAGGLHVLCRLLRFDWARTRSLALASQLVHAFYRAPEAFADAAANPDEVLLRQVVEQVSNLLSARTQSTPTSGTEADGWAYFARHRAILEIVRALRVLAAHPRAQQAFVVSGGFVCALSVLVSTKVRDNSLTPETLVRAARSRWGRAAAHTPRRPFFDCWRKLCC